MDNENSAASEMASMGGKARARALSPEQRSDIAKHAVQARWGKSAKRATHEGDVTIGNMAIPSAVLKDRTRVISQRGMSKALGRVVTGSGTNKSEKNKEKSGDAKLPTFLSANNLKPFIDLELAASLTSPIEYIPLHGGRTAYGFKAELVPKICDVWLRAKDAGVLLPSQVPTADVARILMRGLATVGIIALVDEATGFQDDRARDALAKILEAFVAKELRQWIKTFPSDFYKEMFRLRKLPYRSTIKRPQYIGHLTNDLVYRRLAPGVLAELKRVNPTVDGRRKSKHFQWLTVDIGHPKLQQHLAAVIALMKASESWEPFKLILDKALPVFQPFPLVDGNPDYQE